MAKNLYIIQMAKTGAFKVGQSHNAKKRMKQLQVGCPYPLRLLVEAQGLGHLEKHVHQRCKSYRTRHGSGEWFKEPGLGCIPEKIWSQVPERILEDPDWWKSTS